MKTFAYAIAFAVIVLYGLDASAQQRVSSQRPSPRPQPSGGEKYFVVFLAHQNHENAISMSHTYALFLRTQGDRSARKIIETAVINWLPKSGHISVVRPAEPGVNQDLSATIAWARDNELEISVIGPFEIDADFYGRAVAQSTRLQRGELKYRCFDARSRMTAKNCIHAVADLFEEEELLDTGSSRGLEATRKVVEYFRPRFKSPELTGAEWSALLGEFQLAEYRRPAEDMTAGAE